jgi:hypothetical protein
MVFADGFLISVKVFIFFSNKGQMYILTLYNYLLQIYSQ